MQSTLRWVVEQRSLRKKSWTRPGFASVHNLPQLEQITEWQQPRLLGLLRPMSLPFPTKSRRGLSNRPWQIWCDGPSNFFRLTVTVIFDCGRPFDGSAAWQNSGERTLRETAELDRAVKVGRQYAGRNAAIIVCGDAAIGGMSVNGYPFRYDSGVAILGLTQPVSLGLRGQPDLMVGRAAETGVAWHSRSLRAEPAARVA